MWRSLEETHWSPMLARLGHLLPCTGILLKLPTAGTDFPTTRDEDIGYESDVSCFFLALHVPPNVLSHQTRLDSLRGTFSWFRMTPCSAILRFHTAETMSGSLWRSMKFPDMSSLSIFQSNPSIYDRGRCSKMMNRFAVRVKCCENCKVHLICSLSLQSDAKHLVPVHLQIDQSEFKSEPYIA